MIASIGTWTTGSEYAANFCGNDLLSMGVTFDAGRQSFLISTTRNEIGTYRPNVR